MIPLVLIVVTVETQQLPVASVGRIVVVVVVLVMDRELAQLLAVTFAAAVRTDPRKYLERLLSVGLLQLKLGAPCHASLGTDGDSLLRDSTINLRLTTPTRGSVGQRFDKGAGPLLNELCARPGEYPDSWFDPS